MDVGAFAQMTEPLVTLPKGRLMRVNHQSLAGVFHTGWFAQPEPNWAVNQIVQRKTEAAETAPDRTIVAGTKAAEASHSSPCLGISHRWAEWGRVDGPHPMQSHPS